MNALSFIILISISALGDERFNVRQGASGLLSVCGRTAQPWLEIACHSDDPEVSYRASALLCHCRRQQAKEFADKRRDSWPWCDMLPEILDDTPLAGNDKREVVEQWLREVPLETPQTQDWPRYREATRLMVMEMIAQGISEWDVGELLHRMQEREKEWWKLKKERERP